MGDGEYFDFVDRMITFFCQFSNCCCSFCTIDQDPCGNIDYNVLNWFTRSGADGFDQVGELGLFVLMI